MQKLYLFQGDLLARDDLNESRGRRASDRTPIGRVTGTIERAFGTGDLESAAVLLDQNPIVAWYGFSREKLTEIVTTLEREGIPRGEFLSVLADVLAFGTPGHAPVVADELADGDLSELPLTELARRMFALRLQGRPVEALRASTKLVERFGAAPRLFDNSPGWGLLIAVQHGITAMLAGEFAEALRSFARAQVYPASPALVHLSRDAYVKAAMIEVIYGDTDRARSLIENSDRLERTESWAEVSVDACRDLVLAMLETDDPRAAAERLERFPLRVISEMWPFYGVAMHRVLRAAGDWRRAQFWLETLEELGLPAVDGEGFLGSALPLTTALSELQRGDLAAARSATERADAALPVATLVNALIDIAAGNPQAVLEPLAELRGRTKYLRRLDLWRLAAAAEALLMSGAKNECRETLEFALALPGGLRREELLSFSPTVRGFGERELDAWPRLPDGAGEGSSLFAYRVEPFTERELDLLRALATGRSREQIAKSAFISVNTLKTHLRSVYRKLGVNSRTGAVLEAERRGLV